MSIDDGTFEKQTFIFNFCIHLKEKKNFSSELKTPKNIKSLLMEQILELTFYAEQIVHLLNEILPKRKMMVRILQK